MAADCRRGGGHRHDLDLGYMAGRPRRFRPRTLVLCVGPGKALYRTSPLTPTARCRNTSTPCVSGCSVRAYRTLVVCNLALLALFIGLRSMRRGKSPATGGRRGTVLVPRPPVCVCPGSPPADGQLQLRVRLFLRADARRNALAVGRRAHLASRVRRSSGFSGPAVPPEGGTTTRVDTICFAPAA